MSLFRYTFSTLLLLFCFTILKAQTLNPDKSYEVTCVGFYNLENLFDTIVDPDTNKILQEDFTPKSSKQWNSKKYYSKLDNMADVISKIGVSKSVPDGAAVLGVCEIENKSVLDDLVAHEKLKNKNYQIVHYDSPDKRGIDVGFLYQPKYFKVTSSKSFTLTLPDNDHFFTRDQLLVSGELNGEK
ncbi:MAG: endonuclease/exonuclease/phosphatase family protein, partial [Flavobacteriales bacterium]|nr:endonuclease/exonuclease/phosphatase family protein [Flavobacteriales bacterium]